MLQYTPELALVGSCSLLLNVSASLMLFKGPRAVFRQIQVTLRQQPGFARLGMAPTALGAWLLASQNQTLRRRAVRLASLIRILNPLHVRHLPSAQPFLDWLHDLGCHTLQDLVRLPRAGLLQRTSPRVLYELDAIYGRASPALDGYAPPDTFEASCELDFHTPIAQAILPIAQSLLRQLGGWLDARQQAAQSMEFSFHHEKGRHACPPTRLPLKVSEPGWLENDFLPILTEHIQHLQLPAPVIAVQLHQVQTQPRCAHSASLFPDAVQSTRKEHRLMDLLRARLGPEQVLQPQVHAHHLPEHVNQWVALPSPPGQDASDSLSACAVLRPFWVFDPPVLLQVTHHRPLHQGQPLQLIQGPERIESGWWMPEQHQQRDYFIAADPGLRWYWIYRERGTDDPRWFLQGLFA